jgi:phosphoglycolate phosphatase-like HAD superfamily hydrolase
MRMLAFVDLDLTLFDYTTVREQGTRAALKAMNVDGNIDYAIALMNSVLIPYGDLLVEAGLPNFRREWKAPELFALLSTVSQPLPLNKSAKRFKDFFADIGKTPLLDQGTPVSFRRRRANLHLLRQMLYATQVHAINKEIGELLQNATYRIQIDDAISAFNDYLRKEVTPSEGVEELLRNLRTRGFEVYVVSEGEENIQREKVSVLGLSNDTDGIYVSSSCCQSERLLKCLWNQTRDVSAKGSENLTRPLEVLYDEVLQYANKSVSFFRKILHTVILPPSDRPDFYRSFGWLSEADCSIQEGVHVLLFGDRYDKDLFPGIDAFRNVISIRLLAGKYKSTFQSDFLIQAQLPRPTATVHSVVEAARFIESLPHVETLPRSRIPASPADWQRIEMLRQALQEFRLATTQASSWMVEQFEELEIALRGSETITNE